LRRLGATEPPAATLHVGGIDITPQHATRNGENLPLSKREHALLLLLARNHGRVLTHRQILTALWGPAHTEDVAYLRVYIGQLRKHLGEDTAKLIATEPGVGYRLLDDA
jgi:two-component system KDP operon response regulator KdpE